MKGVAIFLGPIAEISNCRKDEKSMSLFFLGGGGGNLAVGVGGGLEAGMG